LASYYSNATEISFAVPKKSTIKKLRIPSKGEMFRSFALQVSSNGVMEKETEDFLCNCGGEGIVVSESTTLGKLKKNVFEDHDQTPLLILCNPHIKMENNVVLPGQSLKVPCTQAEQKMKLDSTVSSELQDDLAPLDYNEQNFNVTPENAHDRQLMASGPQDGIWGRWDSYSCTHSKNDAYGDNTWIFIGSDPYCESMFTGGDITDGCSAPDWAQRGNPFKHNFVPACTFHDLCYQFSYWKDPVRWPLTVASRVKCDSMLFSQWVTACNIHHCNVWWKHFIGECSLCVATAETWIAILMAANHGQPTQGATYLSNDEKESVRKYSVASLFVESTNSAPGAFMFADVFRQTRGEIRSRMNNKCLDWYQDRVHMHDCHGGSNQQWYRPGFNKYDLRIQADGNRCLDAPGGHGVRVYWHWCHDGPNQKWNYDDKYRLHNVAYPHLCLDIYAWDNNNLAKVVLWPCNDQKNQQWFQP
jgi:hypothetical protein